MEATRDQTVPPLSASKEIPRPGWRHTFIEVSLVLLVTTIYFLTRGLIRGRETVAFANADRVVRLETRLHLNIEVAIQQFALAHPWLITAANDYYLLGHLPVLIAVAVWLYLARPWAYSRFRNAFLFSAFIGLAIYVLLPTAPPRFLHGFIDTMAISGFNVDGSAAGPLYNPYAAMPSLHVGWSFLSGAAIVATVRPWWLRGIGIALPVLMIAAVIITANHFLLDTIAGILVTSVAFLLASLLSARTERKVLH